MCYLLYANVSTNVTCINEFEQEQELLRWFMWREDGKMMEEKYVEEIKQCRTRISHIAFDCTLSALNVSDTLMREALENMSRLHD